jgi:5-methylcytosine-specific restriction protein B
LKQDGSLFSPAAIWTAGHLEDLYRRFNLQPDVSGGKFEAKLAKQLADAPAETVQLAAEVIYVHLAVANDMKGQTKRGLVDLVLSWGAPGVVMPPDLAHAFDTGLCNSGIAFKTFRPMQLWFLIDFARAWKTASTNERTEMLQDPWVFKSWLFDLPIRSAFAQREAILHFVHPETFEVIISRDHKKKIAKSFSDRAPGQTHDVDRALLTIRQSFEAEKGPTFDFYRDGIEELWRGGEPEPKDDPAGVGAASSRKAWLIRPTSGIADWLGVGFCGIGWPELGELNAGIARPDLARHLRAVNPDASETSTHMDAAILDRFLNQMQVGDLVVSVDSSDVYVGVVASESYWEGTDADDPRRRLVEWANPESPIARDSLSTRAFGKLQTLHRVAEITEDLAEFETLATVGIEVKASEMVLSTVSNDLAKSLLLPKEWLDEVVDLLAEKGQAIFYGPPGTGKTYVANAIASHLTSKGGAFALVQFHPSYAYEDFFEGFRPRESSTSSGGIQFELVPGPLRRLADAARIDPGSPYVLIIDEINRANVAKVFGELYFLLEYRDHAISLQYSPEADFTLPPNLYVIGTMNTADRSIALIDAAMRRRFYFVEFFPGREPIVGLLRKWLASRGLPTEAADLLDRLNDLIDDEDFAVGPSYFMTPRVAEAGNVDRIWRRAILPLLEEHYFGTGVDVTKRFGLEALAGPKDETPPLVDV